MGRVATRGIDSTSAIIPELFSRLAGVDVTIKLCSKHERVVPYYHDCECHYGTENDKSVLL